MPLRDKVGFLACERVDGKLILAEAVKTLDVKQRHRKGREAGMVVTLNEAKQYLRIDSSDEDELISRFMCTAENLVLDVSRRPAEELEAYEDFVRTAELYVIAYLYEHREEADHRAMTEAVKYLLFSVRKEAF